MIDALVLVSEIARLVVAESKVQRTFTAGANINQCAENDSEIARIVALNSIIGAEEI